jgi:hypothetical protein
MTLTDILRTELRELLDEAIPLGGSEIDTRFTNTQIDALLTVASDINQAAAEGWRRKALRAMSERGGLQESQAGDEKLKFVSIEAYRDHCLTMAKMFSDLAPGAGSQLAALDPPDVLGISEQQTDLSRILGVD